jgi:hypothetical protein
MTTRASVSGVNLAIRGGYVLAADYAGGLPGADVLRHTSGVRAIQTSVKNLDIPDTELIDSSRTGQDLVDASEADGERGNAK